MTRPISSLAPSGGIYDESHQLCAIDAGKQKSQGDLSSPIDEIAMAKRFDAGFVTKKQVGSSSGVGKNLFGFLSGIMGCGGTPEPIVPGEPISSLETLGNERMLNEEPIVGNLNGIAVSAANELNVSAWSVYDKQNPDATGTFASIRNGTTGGEELKLDADTSSLHLNTTVAALENGETVVAYTQATGETEPTALLAQRYSSKGEALGGSIILLPPAIRDDLPQVHLIPLNQGFLAVYEDGEGELFAQAFDSSGLSQGMLPLGPATGRFAISRGADDMWCLAEIASNNEIKVRTFNHLNQENSLTTINATSLSVDHGLVIAMQPDGSMMLAWNTSDQQIRGAILNPDGEVAASPFVIRDSGLANTLTLSSDHRGNYIFAWEEQGQIYARIYDGTVSFGTFPEISTIPQGFDNFDIQSLVTENGLMSFIYGRSGVVSGAPQINLYSRDYFIHYK